MGPSFDRLVEEARKHLKHLDPWQRGTARTPSTAFCMLMRLFQMELTEAHVRGPARHLSRLSAAIPPGRRSDLRGRADGLRPRWRRDCPAGRADTISAAAAARLPRRARGQSRPRRRRDGPANAQVRKLLSQKAHPCVRGLGFLYLRYVLKPDKLWAHCEAALVDDGTAEIEPGLTLAAWLRGRPPEWTQTSWSFVMDNEEDTASMPTLQKGHRNRSSHLQTDRRPQVSSPNKSTRARCCRASR